MTAGASRLTPAATGMFPKRFESLDGLRGIAALAVVVGHVTHIEPLGAAAVLVFFVISGYCVTAAADSAVHAGVGFRTYMWRRVRRIYPPYLLSVAFFVATRRVRDWFVRAGVRRRSRRTLQIGR
jgi:peptidoglycan/LPS O-acetylase OafA/YrhL